jgi:ribosomal protein S3AE
MAIRKKFIDIELPIIREETHALGSVEELNGRNIKLDLSRKLRGKGVKVTFKLSNEDGTLVGYPSKIELLKAYIRKLMRPRINYVEDSFEVKLADVQVKVKPFLITRKKVSKAVRRNLRNTAKEFLLENLKEKNFLQVCNEILSGSLQKEMHPKLKKVYPLSFCDLRIFETKEIEKINKEVSLEKKEEKILEEAKEILEEKSQIEELEEELAKEESEEKTQAEEVEEELKKKTTKKTSKKKE